MLPKLKVLIIAVLTVFVLPLSAQIDRDTKEVSKAQNLEGSWQYKVENHCQKVIAFYSFRNDSLIVYKNEGCQGFTYSLYKYTIVNDTIVAHELEIFQNIEGSIRFYHINRMTEVKFPLCWFSTEDNCFEIDIFWQLRNGTFEYNKNYPFIWKAPKKERLRRSYKDNKIRSN